MSEIEIIQLERQGGKTTKALEILRSSENNIMFTHSGSVVIDHPLIDQFPHLKNRIFSTYDYKQRLRGKILDTVIVDNAELLDKDLLLDMLHHFTTFPYGMNGLCKIVLTMSPMRIKTFIKPSPLEEMHKIIMESFLNSCDILVKEDLKDYELQFCLDTIYNTLTYIKDKRKK